MTTTPARPTPPAIPPTFYDLIKRDIRALMRAGDPTPAGLLRVAPCLLAALTSRANRATAPAGIAIIESAVAGLPEAPATAMRVLLAFGQPIRSTTLTDRRILAADAYSVGYDRFREAWEDQAVEALVFALAERADPNATMPTPPKRLKARLRTPPPPITAYKPISIYRTRTRRPTQPS
ncbi:hypothetical protein [Pseudofrankia inefficax]|uniref:Uncharacterized protein n=1 Tax=Pseudofrankia inefficax (strain DSM 45817 / CECT 9037 / DDB 130130 / EuI1c) TaxID=298654 RepID=E3J8T7_PSEI1|nr:hypothetical protein [Pseudofrankia inefficax]ADP79670.1 hypothetical protein FraEuI1c_1612 [Pseudofrankia inefficax]